MCAQQENLPKAVDAKLEGWLETSGFALELRVARAFRRVSTRAGAVPRMVDITVEPSKIYLDKVEAKWRETDVFAIAHSPARSPGRRILVVAECKSSTRKPWVVFTDPTRQFTSTNASLDYALKDWGAGINIQALWRSIVGTPCVPGQVLGYSVAEALGGQQPESREAPGPNAAYSAVRQALSAALALRGNSPAQTTGWAQFTLPIVVTAAPLFECWIDDAGTVQTKQVPLTALYAQPAADDGMQLVQIMTERHLVDEWAPGIAQTVEAMNWS